MVNQQSRHSCGLGGGGCTAPWSPFWQDAPHVGLVATTLCPPRTFLASHLQKSLPPLGSKLLRCIMAFSTSPRSGAPHGIRSGPGIVSFPASHGAQAEYETMASTFAYILLTRGKHDAQPWGGPLEILGGQPCPAAPFRELYPLSRKIRRISLTRLQQVLSQ